MERRQPAYWSYLPDRRFVPVNTPKIAHNPPVPNNPVYHVCPSVLAPPVPQPYPNNPVYRVCPSVLPPPPRLAPRPANSKAMVVSTSTSSTWCMADRDAKRKKRMAAYRAYSIEGQVKASLRSSFRWVKNKIVRHH